MKAFNLFAVILIVTSFKCFAQNTDLSVFVGGEFTRLVEIPESPDIIDDEFGYLSHQFNKKSILLGMGLEQSVYKKLRLQLTTSFGRKYINGEYAWSSWGNFEDLKYSHSYNSLLIKHELTDRISFGGGLGYNMFFKVKTGGHLNPNNNQNASVPDEWLGLLNTSYKYKKYYLDFLYAFGIDDKFFLHPTQPSKSFRILLGYNFATLKWKSLKRTKCPKL